MFEKYCNKWKLKVNVGKTKAVIFSKWSSNKAYNFMLNTFVYLDVMYTNTGRFCKAWKRPTDQAMIRDMTD